jgi:S1-C subfamily serine protease
MKEAGMAGSWHPRYFAVRGDVLEYFKEETAKASIKGDERLGISLDHSNVVMGVERGSISARGMAEGDLVIGLNGQPVGSPVRLYSAQLPAHRSHPTHDCRSCRRR